MKDLLLDSIDLAYPEVAKIKRSLSNVSLDSLNSKIRGDGGILVQYFSGSKNFFILSNNGKKTNIQKIEKNQDLLSSLEAFLELPDTDAGRPSAYIRFAVNSFNLYEKLLKPSLDEFKEEKVTRLTIIPDGSLNKISFDALITTLPDTTYIDYTKPDYLVKQYAITYAFSAGILINEHNPFDPLSKYSILAMSYGISENSEGLFSNLEGAGRELEAIKKYARGRYIKGRKATESCFKKYTPDHSVIHLALHGQSGNASNDSTMLIFRKEEGSLDDGFLLPEELYSLNLKAKLVALSSCESGVGKNFRGEGVYSMARAFANTGCPALITTLWKITDHYAVPVMAGFYSGLRKKLTPDQALRKSKTDYLLQADHYSSHPRFWASFIPIGVTKN